MLIYRINNNFSGDGNGWYDGTTIFDEVYVYRPEGTTTQNGNPNFASFSQLAGETAINCTTSPTPYLSDGSAGGLDIREITDNNGTLTFLLLYNLSNNVVLNQPNTWGLFAATNEIRLEDGFSTTPSNSLRTIITELCPGKENASLPHFEFLEVKLTDNSNQTVSVFTIQSEVGKSFNFDMIRNKQDNFGNYLISGKYQYSVKRGNSEIEKGIVLIE
jgi:hypothetical protein